MARLVENFIAYEMSVVNDPANRLARITKYDPQTRRGQAVATAEIKDSDGDIIGIDSMDLSELHPVLWAHNVYEVALGRVLNAQKTVYNGVRSVVVDFQLDSEENSTQEGEIIHRKIVSGTLVGVSMGYDFDPDNPPVITPLDDGDDRIYRNRHTEKEK